MIEAAVIFLGVAIFLVIIAAGAAVYALLRDPPTWVIGAALALAVVGWLAAAAAGALARGAAV